ncbi:MAG: metallophosphoesterase [Eubacterium sp.]|nr:metallophosphoesterase [Eubacterium sp.]
MRKETLYHLKVPVSIALITDTHNYPADEILISLDNHKPDIIFIAGDFIYAKLPEKGLKMEESSHAVSLLRGCSSLAPTFVSIGNHEWMLNEDDIDIIRSTGVTFLDNEYVNCIVKKEGTGTHKVIHTAKTNCTEQKLIRSDQETSANLIIGGLSSASYMAYKIYCQSLDKKSTGNKDNLYPPIYRKSSVIIDKKPDVTWLDRFCAEPAYKILLCHHPEYYPSYLRERDIDLILSGHAHGGQIRIFGQGLFAPGQGLLPKLTSGVIDHRLVISRGLANNTIVPRLFNPEEIVYID